MTRFWQGSTGPVLVVVAVICFSALSTMPADALKTVVTKISGDFKVMALLTTDKDFWEKWDTPRTTTPHFTAPETIAPGEKTRLLIFVSNPEVKNGQTDLVCEVNVYSRQGQAKPLIPEMPCIDSKKRPLKDHFMMMEYSTELWAADGDGLPIEFRVNVRVTDKNADKTVRMTVYVTVARA